VPNRSVSSALSGEEVGKLAQLLARAAPTPGQVAASALEPVVAEMARRARTAWPDLRVNLAAFFAHVGAHWPDEGRGTAASFAALEVEDLYLAFACTQDDARALRAFERELEGELRAAFEKLRIDPARRDDARQQLWEKLFVGAPRPRILDYSGRSRLKFWFRVTVLRALLDDVRSQKRSRERLDEDLLLGAASSDPNPEIEHLKRLYREQFNSAFEAAVKALRPEDRNMLRSSYAQRMTIDQIAAAFGIHRATAARRVNSARDNLLRETRRRLSEQLKLSSRELDSMFKLIESRLDLSVGRLLGAIALFATLALAAAGCQGPTVGPPLDAGAGQAGTTGAAGAGGGDGGTSAGGGRGGGGTTGTAGSGGVAGVGGGAGAAGVAGRGGTGGTGGVGTAGRGGTGGTGAGGSGGAGCAAQMTPQMFYRGTAGPRLSSGTSTRYYWVEYGSPYITLHYSSGATPANNQHPMQFDMSSAGAYDVAASDERVVGTWTVDGKIAVWGPDSNSAQIGSTMTLTYPSAVDAEGTTIFYSFQPTTGTTGTPGIYQWSPTGAPALFESYTNLGGDRTLGLLLRITPNKLLFSDKTDVWYVDRTTKGAKQLLFDNPGTRRIDDVRPARPRSSEGGVLINLSDDVLIAGRDYYVNLSQPGAPKDLSAAITTLLNASACGTAARYNGGGVLFNQRYVYEGSGGLFAVDVSASGDVSNLVRLSDIPLRYPEVTGQGDLFAGWAYMVSRWDYYRVGRL
jgi:RNA polymerase sigma-70 factor (ECF subfamily)